MDNKTEIWLSEEIEDIREFLMLDIPEEVKLNSIRKSLEMAYQKGVIDTLEEEIQKDLEEK